MKHLIERRKRLHDQLQENSLLVLFSGNLLKRSADSSYDFVVNRNFYYLCNLDEDQLVYVCYKKGPQVLETIFIKDTNPVLEKWVGRSLSKQEATQRSGVLNVMVLSQFESMMDRLLARNPITTLYVDYERINLKHASSEGELFAKELRELFPSLNQINVNSLINHERVYKSEEELKILEAAIATTHRALDRVVRKLKPGRMEYEVEADFSYQLKLEKSYPSFTTIVASGADATILHYVSNHKEIKKGDLVLMDCGATHQHYCADITRTFPVSGKFSERQKVFYQIVLDAQTKVFEAIRPGVTLAQLNEVVKRHYQKACVEAKIIEDASQVDQVYYHNVSHSLGLDTHDVGLYEGAPLQEGMVITVEPGLYSAKEGLGVRIEDNVLVTQDGMKNLSADIPKTIEEIESWMRKNL